jgi:heat-inducible transcriptional repressor
MADLEDLGLLYAPHTSAGRLPTEHGLRLFVDGLLECGNLTEDEHNRIETLCVAAGRSLPEVLEQATTMLSGLSRCAGLVTAPKTDTTLRHIEFVSLGPGRALVVLVTDTGLVENRIIDLPLGMPASSLVEATNYLSARLVGRSISEAQERVKRDLERDRATLDALSRKVVETGLASWSGVDGEAVLIVRGQAHLLDDINAIGELERVRALFSALETKEALLRLLQATDAAAGVQIFIGAESELFSLTGCSMVVAPYKNSQQHIVGAVGVIGPMRINYARIVPMVDFTAKAIGRLIG